MFSQPKKEVYLPGWLWFFLLLPLGLIVLLLYRRKRLSSLSRPFSTTSRYTEPDSIPLEVRTGETETSKEKTSEKPSAGKNTAQRKKETAQAESVLQDDLKIIKGIGPSISNLLRNSGIVTFQQLAETPVVRLVEILDDAGLRRLANPAATWPEQARLAAEGSWDELQQYQDAV